MSRCALAIAAALAAGCAGAPSPHQTRSEGAAARPSASPSDVSPLPDAPYFTALGVTRNAPLEIAILPVAGEASVLAVHDFADHPRAFVQLVAASGVLGPAIALEGAHVVGALAGKSSGELVLTSDRKSVV